MERAPSRGRAGLADHDHGLARRWFWSRPIDELESILEEDLGLKPLLLSVAPADLRDRVQVLRQARAVLEVRVGSEEQGRELIDLVRQNSREM